MTAGDGSTPRTRLSWRQRRLAGPVPPGYRWVALTNTTIGAFMSSLDGSILTVSLPTIAADLHTGVGLMLWIMMGYTVMVTALLLPLGRLADLHGRVRFYLLGFWIFTVGSAMSGFAWSGTALLVGRLVQGTGASLLWSNSMAILTDAFPPTQRGLALGINQVAALTGSLGGLVLGGVITSALSWRWIFFLNLPVGVFGSLWTYTSLREIGRQAEPEPFDYLGLSLFTGGVVAILLALTEVVEGAGRALVLGPMVAGLALLAAFVPVERRRQGPLMDLSLFALRAFSFGNLALFLNALARGALMFLFTFAFQGLLGATPMQAGLMLLPLTATILVTGPISGALSDRLGARGLATAGLVLSAVALYLLAHIPVTGPYPPLALTLVLAGLGNGMFNSPNSSAVMGSVPPDRRGVAAAMRSLVFNAGQLFSIGIAFSIVAAAMGSADLTRFLAGAAIGDGRQHAAAFAQGLSRALLLSAALSMVAAFLSFLRDTPHPGATRPHRSVLAHSHVR
jgi:EmrB/QacA subfamily drug resistance transporter